MMANTSWQKSTSFSFVLLDGSISRDHWTPIEIEVMTDHRWWSVEELTSTREVVFPETLVAILASIDQADTSPS